MALPLLFYAAASVAYAIYFARRNVRAGLAGTGALMLGALVHTFLIGMQTVEVGYVPFAGTTAALSAFVWLLALAYLYTEMTTNERAMGVFIGPMLTVLQVIPAVSWRPAEPPEVLRNPLFMVHVSSLLFAYASFALACVIGITYVLLFKEIKAKHLGFFYARLPSLQKLDMMNQRAVTVGWVLLTVGVVVGAVWAMQLEVRAAPDPKLQAMTPMDPKILVALLSWVLYTFQLYARRAIGWSGKRAAWLSAIGFAIVMLNFVPVGYFLTRSHNF